MEAKISNEVYFLDGCVIEDDFVYVACNLEDVDPREYTHSRLSVYDAQSTQEWKWFYHDVDANIVSVCVKQPDATRGRLLCSLSKEGEVELFDNANGPALHEKISGAGVRLGTGGYVSQIREIGAALFVCGQHGQVYKRTAAGWIHVDQGLFNVPEGFDSDAIMLNSIDGNHENDVYVAGDDGKIFHFNGTSWSSVETGIDEHLNWIRVYGNAVWACGYNGALLTGNARSGFRDVSSSDDNLTFQSLARFQDKIFLATINDGVFVYDGVGIRTVDSGLNPPVQSHHLDCRSQVLWSFGVKDICWFDGKRWVRVDHPDNPAL
ncbi:hypothetical protein F2P44_32590 [Massilia sp. CCM 8695]|uniref:Glucosyl transferase n=1 Tax=Massilia frigida TaxID=2609281 RepID=A0ABX0NFL3_9BURK|nr:hypothetical protein [Massilia frigida]NHZ83967.1 hypothetical protein [Massilia frigida]